ncbi:MAG: hypothetical protein QNJ90_15875 [Planctomycetota bacterium]|nr:hypothetical protein [Planctomycetota bacterium]
MSTSPPDAAKVEAAAYAVTEFAIVSLNPEYLRWDKDVNLGIAEMVWNACSAGPDEVIELGWLPEFAEMADHLTHVRKARWGDERFLVLGLDARQVDGEIVFCFDLTWDHGETFESCEITWVPRLRDASLTN